MFENFTVIDFITLTALILLCAFVITVIVIALSKKNRNSVLDKVETVYTKEPIEIIDEPIDQEILVIEEQKPAKENNEIAEVLMAMQKDLELKNQDPIELFEQEQEENAIISYQELLKTKIGKEPLKVEKQVPKMQSDSKFMKSAVISPIYGNIESKSKVVEPNNPENPKEPSLAVNVEDNRLKYDEHALEKTLNIDPISTEIKRNDEFLKALKEFRKNL